MKQNPELDLAEKLFFYRQMPEWSLKHEVTFVDNFTSYMVNHLTTVEGHSYKVARERIKVFLAAVSSNLKAIHDERGGWPPE